MANRAPYPEYSLWNDSAYRMFFIQPHYRIVLARPVSGSIFLTPSDLEDRDRDPGGEIEEEQSLPSQPRMRRSPGFERYMRRSQKVVTRESLLQDPALFRKDPDSDESDCSPERSPDLEMFIHPPRPRWRTALQVHGRGRRVNPKQRRLEQALSQPARIERGSNRMHRTDWVNGSLSHVSGEIVQTATPDPYYVHMLNAAYANANATAAANFSPSQDSADDSSDSDSYLHSRLRIFDGGARHRSKKQSKEDFIINVLKHVREFVRNDLQIELFFEQKLEAVERRRIHHIVARLMGQESEIEFSTADMVHIAREIERRNGYNLGTQSEGEGVTRQICIYKEARTGMFLITPDDIRYPQPEDMEEETNPFLQSIARHRRDNDPHKVYTMLDRVIDFFAEFTDKENFTEFRFIGAFSMAEIDMLSSFFTMSMTLIEKRPYLDYPERLVDSFERGVDFASNEDANGFISILKSYKRRATQRNMNI